MEEIQYFSSDAPGNQNIKYVNVEPTQVKKVVVPYGPLKYNRFYDWPPEPQYARVYACPPPRNTLNANTEYYSDEEFSHDEGFLVDAKAKGKKKKKNNRKRNNRTKNSRKRK